MTRIHAIPTACCLLLAGLVASAPPATAAASGMSRTHRGDTLITTTVSDPDDTDGRLDISRAGHRIHSFAAGHASIAYRISTFHAFRSRRLDPRHRNFVIELNQDTERGSERNIRVSFRHGRLTAELTSNATRQVIDTLDVTRPNRHTVRVHGPRRLVGARSYFAYSNFHATHSAGCGWDGYPVTCQDSVPQRGWMRMDHQAWP